MIPIRSLWMASLAMLVCSWNANGQSQVWEFSPYRVNVWVSLSPSLQLDQNAELDLYQQIQKRCEADFGGTWSIRVQSTPDSLYGSVLYRIDELTVNQVLAREMTLVVGKSDAAKAKFLELNPPPPPVKLTAEEEAKRLKLTKEQIKELEDAAARAASLLSVRTFESAVERINAFHVLPLPFTGLKREVAPFESDEKWKKFSEKLQPFSGDLDSLKRALDEGEIVAALVPKTELAAVREVSRSIPARLPWQPEALLRDYDKIYMVAIDLVDGAYRVRTKEMDSLVRRMGDLGAERVLRPQDLGGSIARLLRASFTPMVRIEETDNFSATMRVRAAGLITGESHPAQIGLGDVVIPFIRRDDMNGNPTVLQAMPFTFIAATEKIDKTSLYYGAIFAASRGALTAAKNRRTQRLGLKVTTKYPESELHLKFRPPFGMPQNVAPRSVPGAEVYLRTPGSDDLVMVGRTDWRGVLPLTNGTPPKIRYEIPANSRNPGISEARKIVSESVPPPEYPQPAPEATGATDENAPKAPSKPPKGEVQINVPLYLYYVKNGDTLLARLPIVTGFYPVDEAKLPDDRRRLETEAFLKGLQNEVLDLVVRRKILESRVNAKLKEGKVSEAQTVLEDLKRIKNYERMSEQIESVQRRATDESRGRVGPVLQKKIDEMVDSTRKIMQQWLQDDLLRDLENKVNEAK
ncbi:hypothetical protein VN12_25720 [Pirellula sp. SH-Sr6A]|uniref:hypothetical protein n=1 Tax=Pirellula sp. SH-Sr6A TaxID=1632865 RepID=UPI00078BD282|nr:hypothetical protein [Pirellula sp. SH-Sr6A]AMV35516.1 hypothetical protein VN12_25720 [Pirellula sp. SH-Sr6A]